MSAALRLLRGLSLLSCVLLAGLVPAVALTWLWWYVRRHGIQLVYRLLFPLLLNSAIALIPMNIPAIDEVQWPTTVATALVIAGVWLAIYHLRGSARVAPQRASRRVR